MPKVFNDFKLNGGLKEARILKIINRCLLTKDFIREIIIILYFIYLSNFLHFCLFSVISFSHYACYILCMYVFVCDTIILYPDF